MLVGGPGKSRAGLRPQIFIFPWFCGGKSYRMVSPRVPGCVPFASGGGACSVCVCAFGSFQRVSWNSLHAEQMAAATLRVPGTDLEVLSLCMDPSSPCRRGSCMCVEHSPG